MSGADYRELARAQLLGTPVGTEAKVVCSNCNKEITTTERLESGETMAHIDAAVGRNGCLWTVLRTLCLDCGPFEGVPMEEQPSQPVEAARVIAVLTQLVGHDVIVIRNLTLTGTTPATNDWGEPEDVSCV